MAEMAEVASSSASLLAADCVRLVCGRPTSRDQSPARPSGSGRPDRQTKAEPETHAQAQEHAPTLELGHSWCTVSARVVALRARESSFPARKQAPQTLIVRPRAAAPAR